MNKVCRKQMDGFIAEAEPMKKDILVRQAAKKTVTAVQAQGEKSSYFNATEILDYFLSFVHKYIKNYGIATDRPSNPAIEHLNILINEAEDKIRGASI